MTNRHSETITVMRKPRMQDILEFCRNALSYRSIISSKIILTQAKDKTNGENAFFIMLCVFK